MTVVTGQVINHSFYSCRKDYVMWLFCILGILKYNNSLFKHCSFLICIFWQWFYLCIPSTEAIIWQIASICQFNLFSFTPKKWDLHILTTWEQTKPGVKGTYWDELKKSCIMFYFALRGHWGCFCEVFITTNKPEENRKSAHQRTNPTHSHIHSHFEVARHHGNLSCEVEKSPGWDEHLPEYAAGGTEVNQCCLSDRAACLVPGWMFRLQQDPLCNLFFSLDTRQKQTFVTLFMNTNTSNTL